MNMKKMRISALLLVIVMLITACGGAALTEEEYKTEFTAFYKSYASLSGDIVALLEEEKYSEAAESANKNKVVLDDFTRIVPPEKFKPTHDDLVKSIDGEKKYLEATIKFLNLAEKYDSLSESEKADAEKVVEDMDKAMEESTFQEALLASAKAIGGKG